MNTHKLLFLVCLGLGPVLSGCSSKTLLTPPKQTVNEQLLLDQSLEKTLSNASLPLLPGKAVAVEVASLGDAASQAYVLAAVTRWLGQQGFRVPNDKQETYLLRVMVHSFASNVGETFSGMPPITGGLFPIATPELAVSKSQTQGALTRLSMDIYERGSGRLLMTTPNYEGYAYLKDSVILFAIPKRSTNLSSIPD
jgi:hypothetical protein